MAIALAVRASRLRITLLGTPVEPDVVTTTAVPARTSAGRSCTMPEAERGSGAVQRTPKAAHDVARIVADDGFEPHR